MLAMGFTSLLTVQAFVNMGVVTALLPNRITSYNVCYTKLLRKFIIFCHLTDQICNAFGSLFILIKPQNLFLSLEPGYVITSYSIHYTKLYDPFYHFVLSDFCSSDRWCNDRGWYIRLPAVRHKRYKKYQRKFLWWFWLSSGLQCSKLFHYYGRQCITDNECIKEWDAL